MQAQPDATVSTALETVIIFTGRMEELAAFYQESLQLGTFERSPQHMGLRVGPIYLGFDQVEEVGGDSRASVSLWFTVEDIQATYDRLVAMGGKVRYPPTQKPWGGFLACVYDPDGNMLGLSQRQQ
jgi:predicted enzyme related to lactoylglutathione lyase